MLCFGSASGAPTPQWSSLAHLETGTWSLLSSHNAPRVQPNSPQSSTQSCSHSVTPSMSIWFNEGFNSKGYIPTLPFQIQRSSGREIPLSGCTTDIAAPKATIKTSDKTTFYILRIPFFCLDITLPSTPFGSLKTINRVVTVPGGIWMTAYISLDWRPKSVSKHRNCPAMITATLWLQTDWLH